jgi:L-ascorbate metabolism protein UlaG (beta-lactamase superfamily)
VKLTSLGHAGWLVEAGGLRILFDPALGRTHAGGVFQVVPQRSIEPAELRADFVVVTHAHFDHFDVDSLDALARFDPDSVLITPDELVASSAEALGFRTVQRVAPATRIELDGVTLATTPSHAPDVEWGAIVADDTGTAWNMVDTVFRSPHNVREIARASLAGRTLDVALAPIQPLREIELATAGRLGLDLADYQHLLACGAATGARVLAPSACGEAFTPPFAAMNAFVYPISRERALCDLRSFAPATRTLNPALGEMLVILGGEVSVAPGELAIQRAGAGDPRDFRPLEIAPLTDPNVDGRDVVAMRDRVHAWVGRELAPALARELGPRPELAKLALVLEVVFTDGRAAYTFDTRGNVREASDPEYDVLLLMAGSMLDDVIAGRRAWVEPLLAGLMRSSVRGVNVARGACAFFDVAPMFVYYAISYRASTERAVSGRVAALRRARA